jgi:glycosyltransferase involved in cell wall biosynthesis
MMTRVTFVMEQHIGHRTYYQNLRSCVEDVDEIDASWVEITYEDSASPWSRYSLLPRSIKGTLVGRSQARKGVEQEADIVFFNTQVPAVLSGKSRQLRNYLVATDITPSQYDRMSHWYGHKPDGDGWISHYKHRLNRQVLNNASFLLPWSNWTAGSLVEDYGVSPDRVMTVPPGVDLAVWSPKILPERDQIRILFVGGDFYRKGGDLLLETFEALLQMFPARSLELALVTNTQVAHRPGVKIYRDMKPNSPDLIHLYQSSDIFVLPTRAEAFGIAAVEASAVGLPVVATRVGGLADIVEDGETGFLIDPEELQPLVDALTILIENHTLRSDMGRAGLLRAQERFDATRNAEKIIHLLLAAAREKGVPEHVRS